MASFPNFDKKVEIENELPVLIRDGGGDKKESPGWPSHTWEGGTGKKEFEKRTNPRIVQGVVQLSAFVTVSNIGTHVLQTFEGWVGIGPKGFCLVSHHHHVHHDPLHHENELKESG